MDLHRFVALLRPLYALILRSHCDGRFPDALGCFFFREFCTPNRDCFTGERKGRGSFHCTKLLLIQCVIYGSISSMNMISALNIPVSPNTVHMYNTYHGIPTLQKVVILLVNASLDVEKYVKSNFQSFIRTLLQYFHVAIWSKMPLPRLREVMHRLLCDDLRAELLCGFSSSRRLKAQSGTERDFDFLIGRLSVDSQRLRIVQEKKDLILDLGQAHHDPGSSDVLIALNL
jgi:hypothetical protein